MADEKQELNFRELDLMVKLAKACETAGATPDEMNAIAESSEFLADMLAVHRGNAEIVQIKILEIIGTVTIPAATEKFIAREKFVVNTADKTQIKIGFLGGNFENWFLAGDGKIEDSLGENTLSCHKLLNGSVDGPIIAELGEAKAETTLAELFFLLSMQGKGQEGVLLTNGRWNIFYIRDCTGVLRAVCVRWRSDLRDWRVGACSVGNPAEWAAGRQVFSRNS